MKTNRIGRLLLVVAMGLSMASCIKETQRSTTYYNIDSLITAQVVYLTNAKASVKKVVRMDGSVDSTAFQPRDTTTWKKELDIFRELDAFNRPIYAKSYILSDGVPDTRSNLMIRTYSGNQNLLGKNEKLPVEYVKIYYHRYPNKIRKVEGQYAEENSLYSSSRFFSLEFTESNQQAVLTSYAIQGGQKMFMGDSVQYTISGSVTLPD